VKAIADEFSRRILGCSIEKGRTVDEICVEQGIPQSTCYKRIIHLVEIGAMVIERIFVSPSGKRFAVYRSAYSHIDISWGNGTLSAYATVNPDIAEKLENARLNRLNKIE
jgi:hypothetical protein